MSFSITDAMSERKMPVNPFTDEYWEDEIKAYGLRKSKYHVEHISVDWFTINGRCDDYLNINMRFSKVEMPRLAINGHLWMSLTPMELQSAALALHRARGHVVSGGLGLGYFALRAAAKESVTKVTVFENEPLVIEWFKRVFKDRVEMAKIEIVEGDIRKTFKGYSVDFCFMDIYADMLPDEVLTDISLFRRRNKIVRYHFWGYEKVVLELLAIKAIKYGVLLLGSDLAAYFRTWNKTPMGTGDDTTLGMCHRSSLDIPYLKKAQRKLVDFPL